jgi:ribosome maturation factor RimP
VAPGAAPAPFRPFYLQGETAIMAGYNDEKWAGKAHFFLVLRATASQARDANVNLNDRLERTLPPLGYELVDVELSAKGRLVRVFIDKPQGVDVEDCARVSAHLTRLFAVENVDFDRLEVSSPGLDRPLKRAGDYARFAGQEVKLTLREPIDGARRLKGTLHGLDGDAVRIETATGMHSIPLGGIERARLVPKIEWR